MLELLKPYANSPIAADAVQILVAYMVLKKGLVNDVKKDFNKHFDNMASKLDVTNTSLNNLNLTVKNMGNKLDYVQETHWDEIKKVKGRLDLLENNKRNRSS